MTVRLVQQAYEETGTARVREWLENQMRGKQQVT